MLKLQEFINNHQTWFTSERLPLKVQFLESFFIRLHLWSLHKIEKGSLENIEGQQLKRLKRLVEHAYKTVPFWKKYMDNIGIRPKDIQKLQDLSKIPLTTKLMLKGMPKEYFISSTITKKRHHKIVTSGTTGIPTEVYTDTFTKELRMAIRLRGFYWVVGKRNKKDVYIRIASTNTFYPGFILVNNIEFAPLKEIKDRLYKICKNNQCIITSYSSFMTHLAELIQKEGNILPLKGVVISGESLGLPQKQLLEEVFQCPIGGRYSSSEGGGTIAHTCVFGKYHVNFDQCIVEIVPYSKTGGAVENFGKVLITDLNNYVMPFIRYEIGDIGKFVNEQCKCGNTFPIIEFLGREAAVVNLPNGTKLHSFNLVHLLSIRRKWILRYQIIRKDFKLFEIYLVVKPEYPVNSFKKLKEDMEKLLGNNTIVSIKTVSHIKTPLSKKFRPFISHFSGDRL